MDDREKFKEKNKATIKKMAQDKSFKELSQNWYLEANKFEYAYHFTWWGLPIIQYPQDMIAMQEIIFEYQPDLIIETGIARGGSLVFYASLLKLLGGNRKIVGIDIDIREHNKNALLQHPLIENIILLEGSSTNDDIIEQVEKIAKNYQKIILVLDSNHTKEHVLHELNSYQHLMSKGGYIIVFDTQIANTPLEGLKNRPWGPNDNPMLAVKEFLASNDRFEIQSQITDKLMITECPNGYLKCLY